MIDLGALRCPEDGAPRKSSQAGLDIRNMVGIIPRKRIRFDQVTSRETIRNGFVDMDIELVPITLYLFVISLGLPRRRELYTNTSGQHQRFAIH